MTADRGTQKLKLLGKFFEPSTDFYALLNAQAGKTLEGMEALVAWFQDGAPERGQKVRDLEKEADELKLTLESKLTESFVTPFDREDIYDLSVRTDEIINAAKATVREVEALEVTPDADMLEMATVLVEGTRCIKLSFEALKHNPKEASNQAGLARKSDSRFNKVYRVAMRRLFELDDLKLIMKRHEVFSTMVHAAERIEVVGEKLAHVVVKIC